MPELEGINMGTPVLSPVESWLAVTFQTRYRMLDLLTQLPPLMHSFIVAALTDDTRWTSSPGTNRDPVINQIVTSAVLDFREAYGAAFDDTGKTDSTLVPTSCLPYIDATVYYNVALVFGLYQLASDGVTRNYLVDTFEPAWRDASVYRRHIAKMRRLYREEVDASLSAEGTPVYYPRSQTTARCL